MTPAAVPALPGLTAEQAARDHLTRFAPWYGLDADDVRGARLRDVHDTGEGGIIVSLKQEIDGVEVSGCGRSPHADGRRMRRLLDQRWLERL